MPDRRISTPAVDEMPWRKSSYSNPNGECVEVATTPDRVLMRDSKNPDGARLTFTAGEWGAFVAGIRAGEFDLSV